MSTMGTGAVARMAAVLMLAAGVATPLWAAPPAHVMERGELPDQQTAYVVLAPHLSYMGNALGQVEGEISGRTPDGQSRAYAVELSTVRPTLIRVEPGRYYFSHLHAGDYWFPMEENESQFDAKAGQVNYPGDWDISVAFHAMTRGARVYGWRIGASLISGERGFDIAALGVDPAFAALKSDYTRVEPAGHPTGMGER